jgi:hypothetical protein
MPTCPGHTRSRDDMAPLVAELLPQRWKVFQARPVHGGWPPCVQLATASRRRG